MKTIPEAITLPMWAGFRSGLGEGFKGEIRTLSHGWRVTDRQYAALEATIERAAEMQPKILAAVEKVRPKSIPKAQIRKHIDLWQVIFSRDHFEDVAYVAYCFECSWSDGGVVVLTHKDRIVSVGSYEVVAYPHLDPERDKHPAKRPTAAQRKAAVAAAKKRALKNPTTLPDESDQELTITLPNWAGFYAGPGEKVSTGEVGLSIGGATMGANPTTAAQQKAYRHLLKHAEKQQRKLLDELAAEAPRLAKEKNLLFSGKPARKDMETFVALAGIHLHWEQFEGLAYVGYELVCAWNREHGVGVVMYGDRVVDRVAHQEIAISHWIAERDRKRQEKAERSSRRRV